MKLKTLATIILSTACTAQQPNMTQTVEKEKIAKSANFGAIFYDGWIASREEGESKLEQQVQNKLKMQEMLLYFPRENFWKKINQNMPALIIKDTITYKEIANRTIDIVEYHTRARNIYVERAKYPMQHEISIAAARFAKLYAENYNITNYTLRHVSEHGIAEVNFNTHSQLFQDMVKRIGESELAYADFVATQAHAIGEYYARELSKCLYNEYTLIVDNCTWVETDQLFMTFKPWTRIKHMHPK